MNKSPITIGAGGLAGIGEHNTVIGRCEPKKRGGCGRRNKILSRTTKTCYGGCESQGGPNHIKKRY